MFHAMAICNSIGEFFNIDWVPPSGWNLPSQSQRRFKHQLFFFLVVARRFYGYLYFGECHIPWTTLPSPCFCMMNNNHIIKLNSLRERSLCWPLLLQYWISFQCLDTPDSTRFWPTFQVLSVSSILCSVYLKYTMQIYPWITLFRTLHCLQYLFPALREASENRKLMIKDWQTNNAVTKETRKSSLPNCCKHACIPGKDCSQKNFE